MTVSTPADVDAEKAPLTTPKSYLTLSARPEVDEHDGGASAVERLERLLRHERDPITPELLREKLSGRPTGLRALIEDRTGGGLSESERRALWGDR